MDIAIQRVWERRRATRSLFLVLALCLLPFGIVNATSQALGYSPKYGEGFDHFEYVNPQAPKGGDFVMGVEGTFDGLNPFTLKGALAAAGLGDLLFESLMEPSRDEPFSQYGLLADQVQLAKDKLSVTYHINPRAHFSDGTPVTAHDVKFSFDTLKSDKAHPRFRYFWADILRAVAVDAQTVRFEFARVNPELHMIAGQIPIFSQKWVGGRDFGRLGLERPIGSGPYVVGDFALGKQITYVRNPDYWGGGLNTRRGMYNFDRIVFKYYRDGTVLLEGLKAGEFDFIFENNSKQWARDYVGPNFDKGLIRKATFKHSNNAGMQGFIFNTRRDLFKDRRVRRAISLALDFEWANRKLFYGQYTRCDSYFSNSELASHGIPQGDELALLERFRSQLPDEVFSSEWQPPTTGQAEEGLRDNLREAKRLLAEAGWRYRDGALRNASGQPFVFEILLAQRGFERIVAPFARNLAKLGIEVNYRTVDLALYQRREESFDFDMIVESFGESQSPGNELMDMFHSRAADQEASGNIIGVKDPVVDALIHEVIYAKDRAHLVTAVHALDRVLLHGDYLVPNWYIGVHRVAYWDRFGIPETLPLYYSAPSWALSTWWVKPGGVARGNR